MNHLICAGDWRFCGADDPKFWSNTIMITTTGRMYRGAIYHPEVGWCEPNGMPLQKQIAAFWLDVRLPSMELWGVLEQILTPTAREE